MAAPSGQVLAVDFGSWLEQRLEELGMDPAVYPAYIQGVLREEEDNHEERDEALRGILAAFLEEDSIEEVCLEIVTKWNDTQKAAAAQASQEDEVQALASMIEKQAQIVVKTKEVSEEEQQRKAAVLAQYANITDDENEDEDVEAETAASPFSPDKSLFKNTNLEDLMNAKKLERDSLKEASSKKKEQDKQQREKDKAAKQERKDREKKRTQKGERKR
ncbi:coiled-coil domain-containing protein 43 [Spea bombifrons]|uniref:coiled-coil domain-containing protein 43 n=1 Tax=Spea bombifrons TaxID=233779 RepID=UPI00234A59D0|nr:coiled-coil domain-containing protein 43 [Spea bombifrons]